MIPLICKQKKVIRTTMTAKQIVSKKTHRKRLLFSLFSSVAALKPDILTWDNMSISLKDSWEPPLNLFRIFCRLFEDGRLPVEPPVELLDRGKEGRARAIEDLLICWFWKINKLDFGRSCVRPQYYFTLTAFPFLIDTYDRFFSTNLDSCVPNWRRLLLQLLTSLIITTNHTR